MTTNRLEGESALGVSHISAKTPNDKLREWSSNHWSSEKRRFVAKDIIKNGRELLKGRDIDWDKVLGSIRVNRYNRKQSEEAAIAEAGARFIGGFAARCGWSMDRPAIVYLSGKFLANIAGSNMENFKTTMNQAAVSYGENTLPEPKLFMKTIDMLLKLSGRDRQRAFAGKVKDLLSAGMISEAYKEIKSRRDTVRSRR